MATTAAVAMAVNRNRITAHATRSAPDDEWRKLEHNCTTIFPPTENRLDDLEVEVLMMNG